VIRCCNVAFSVEIVDPKTGHDQQRGCDVQYVRYVSAVRGVLGIAGAHARGCEQIVDRCAREIVWFYLVAGVWIDVIHLALRIDVVDPGVACAVVDDVATKVVESGHNPIPHSTDGKIAYEVLLNVGGDDVSLLIADPEAEFS